MTQLAAAVNRLWVGNERWGNLGRMVHCCLHLDPFLPIGISQDSLEHGMVRETAWRNLAGHVGAGAVAANER